MSDPHPGTAGFTLLELLVTMSLLGLLTMVMFGSMRFGVQVWARTGTDLTAANDARKAEAVIAADLSRAYPLYSTTGTTAEIAFDGEAHRIRYLTPSQMAGALETVALEATGENDAQDLIRRSRAELATSGEDKRKILLAHVQAVAFSYFGASHDGDKPTWSTEWRRQTRLPQLIRVAIALKDGSSHVFVAAPRLTADAGCVFDALTKSCRGR